LLLIVVSCSIKIPLSSHQACGKIPLNTYTDIMTDAAILTGQFTEDVYDYVRSTFRLDTTIYFRSTFTSFKKDTFKILFHYDSLEYGSQGSRIMIKPASFCKWSDSLAFNDFEYEVVSEVYWVSQKETIHFKGNYLKERAINNQDTITGFTLIKPIESHIE